MSKIGQKIKEAVGAVDNLSKFKKFSKLKASYIEYDKFVDSNLHEGYFCYNCIYWINSSGGKCMLVEDKGPDVLGNVSNVIAAHGCCAGYEANYDKLHDTRSLEDVGPGSQLDTDANALEQYQNPEKRRGGKKQSAEEVAHKAAWAAVKRDYICRQG